VGARQRDGRSVRLGHHRSRHVLLHALLPAAPCSGRYRGPAAALLAHAETARRVCSAAADSVKGLQRAAGVGQRGHKFSGARCLWATSVNGLPARAVWRRRAVPSSSRRAGGFGLLARLLGPHAYTAGSCPELSRSCPAVRLRSGDSAAAGPSAGRTARSWFLGRALPLPGPSALRSGRPRESRPAGRPVGGVPAGSGVQGVTAVVTTPRHAPRHAHRISALTCADVHPWGWQAEGVTT
jgi:hypothetical protein